MPDAPLLPELTQLSWQGTAVIGLLFLSVLLSKILKLLPRDLIFTVAALLTALFGIVTSNQVYFSAVSQAVFAVLGLWLLGKGMQHQGFFHTLATLFSPNKKGKTFSRVLFYLQTAFCGAFFHHRYFPLTVLRPLLRRAERGRWSLEGIGAPFGYLLVIGGLATAIGTPANILLLDLYSSTVAGVLSDIFFVLPLSILPILFSVSFFLLFQKRFRRPFPQVLEAPSCGAILPDSLAIGKATDFPVLRDGKLLAASTPLESGDLLLLYKEPPASTFSLLALFDPPSFARHVRWKRIAAPVLFLAAVLSTFAGAPVGTAFLCSGLLALLLRIFPVKKSFREEFPLPALLEIFSAHLFFFAMLSSGLNVSLASLASCKCPYLLLTLFFISSQAAVHFIPRAIALATLFSIALALFNGHPDQILFSGTVIAFAAAAPLFGKPQVDPMAISNAVSPKPPFLARTVLLILLFFTVVVPACLFWP
ncbi:MAG: hypothetical protein JSS60_00055 [Verrucomicrobia bacterium]|nr:hypothetical protein [Verrucomicrobiota bacterium]